jgi:hypothetical protein
MIGLSCLCYVAALLWGEYWSVRDLAVWSDYQDGVVTREQAREKVGDVVDTWKRPNY